MGKNWKEGDQEEEMLERRRPRGGKACVKMTGTSKNRWEDDQEEGKQVRR